MPSLYSIDQSEVTGKRSPARSRPGVETRNTLCATCDISCNVVTEIEKEGESDQVAFGNIQRSMTRVEPEMVEMVWLASTRPSVDPSTL